MSVYKLELTEIEVACGVTLEQVSLSGSILSDSRYTLRRFTMAKKAQSERAKRRRESVKRGKQNVCPKHDSKATYRHEYRYGWPTS